MIRKLTEQNRQQIMDFVVQHPAENLFIIGDIERYGFNNPIQILWGDFDENHHIRGVLLKFNDNYIIYGLGEFDAKGFAALINNDEKFQFVSGMASMVKKLEPYLVRQPVNARVLYYAKCEKANALEKVPNHIEVKKAIPDDAERMIAHMQEIPEFAESVLDVERKREALRTGESRTYYIEEKGVIISSASSAAENIRSAMVIGVGTIPAYQKKGLASYCMSVLCDELLQEGKMLCLFYDNPAAGSIYKRIGFIDIGKWGMLRINHSS